MKNGTSKTSFADAIKRAQKKELRTALWKPEKEGEHIIGRVAQMRTTEGKFGEQIVLTLALPEGGARVIYANKVLARELEGEEVKEGHDVAIVYRGQTKTSRNGRPCRLYAVARVR